MAKTLSEEKVLKKLGIPDFRHMTKDKVVQFASMLHKMDPAVAMKIIDQFPQYRQLASEMVDFYQEVAKNILMANASSMQPFYDACSSILSTLQKELEDNDITADERTIINKQMIEVAHMIGEKDTENKHFIASLVKWLGIGLGTIIGGAFVFFGLKKTNNDNTFDA